MTTNKKAIENDGFEPSNDDELLKLEQAAAELDIDAGIVPDAETQCEGGNGDDYEQKAALDNELLELVTNVIGVTAHTFAPNWGLKPAEINDVSLAYTKLLQKYLPTDGFSRYGEEINAVLVTLIIVQSRAGKPLKIEQKEKGDSSSTTSLKQNEQNEPPVINEPKSKKL